MRCLVLGGAGFIGSHVCEEILRRRHDVSVIDNMSNGREENVPPAVTTYRCDIRKWSDLQTTIRGFEPEVIVHLAAQADVVASCEDPHKDAETNIIGLLNVLRAATEAGTRRIVFASSGGTVYGSMAPIPTPEETPLDPICPYGISKAAGEWHLRHWAERNGREGIALRLGNVYGPRDRRGVVSKFARMRLRGETPTVRNARRDYVFVRDVAWAFCQAAEVPDAWGAYNVGGGDGGHMTVEVLAAVDVALGVEAQHERAPLMQGEVPSCVLRHNRDGSIVVRKPFCAGVAETVASVQAEVAS